MHNTHKSLSVPVLMYHAVSKDKKSNRYTIEEGDFQRQLEYLACHNFKSLSAADCLNALTNNPGWIPGKKVVITFDDGHESDYGIVLPLLKRYGFVANFFITTDWIGKTGYMDGSQLRCLHDEGMVIQSHAKTHSFLDRMKADQINDELAISKKTLEDIVGSAISFVSFPGGRFNNMVVECARSLKFAALFCSKPFFVKDYSDICLIGRYGMKQQVDTIHFEKVMERDLLYAMTMKSLYTAKFLLDKTIGTDLYYRVWKKVNRK